MLIVSQAKLCMLKMMRMWRRDIHGINIGIANQLFISAVSFRDSKIKGETRRLLMVSRADGLKRSPFNRTGKTLGKLASYISTAENSPANSHYLLQFQAR